MNHDSPNLVDANRYAELDLDGDAVIVYDRARTQAWIQSDVTVPTGVATDATASESERRRERRLAAAHAEHPVNGGDSE